MRGVGTCLVAYTYICVPTVLGRLQISPGCALSFVEDAARAVAHNNLQRQGPARPRYWSIKNPGCGRARSYHHHPPLCFIPSRAFGSSLSPDRQDHVDSRDENCRPKLSI